MNNRLARQTLCVICNISLWWFFIFTIYTNETWFTIFTTYRNGTMTYPCYVRLYYIFWTKFRIFLRDNGTGFFRELRLHTPSDMNVLSHKVYTENLVTEKKKETNTFVCEKFLDKNNNLKIIIHLYKYLKIKLIYIVNTKHIQYMKLYYNILLGTRLSVQKWIVLLVNLRLCFFSDYVIRILRR